MISFLKKFFFISAHACLIFMFQPKELSGANYYLKVNGGAWNAAATWYTDACGGVTVAGSAPGAGDNVYICSGITVDIDNSGTPQCNNLTMQGGTISYSNNKTLTVNGNLTVTGGVTSTVVISGGGANPNRKFNVTGICQIDAGSTLDMGGASWTQTGAVNIDGTLNFTVTATGNKTFNNNIVISVTGTFNNSTGETPTINGNITNNGSWIGCTGGTCTYTMGSVAGTYTITGNAIAMSVLSVSSSTTVINTGILVLDGTPGNILTGNGTFTNSTNGILYVSGGVGGSPVTVTTFNSTASPNTVYYNGSGNQAVRTPTDGGYYDLVIGNSGIKNYQNAATTIVISNSLIIKDAAVFDIDGNTLNGAGSLTMTETSDFQISKLATTVPELTGTYSLTAGTITLDGGGAQTLRTSTTGGTACYNLILGNSGAKTITGLLTVNGDMTVSGNATIAAHSAFVQNCSKTFTYSSGGTTTLTAATDIGVGNFLQTTGTLNDNSNTITFCGSTFVYNGGTFTANGRATFNAAATTVSGSSTTTFNNVTINAGMTLVGHATSMNIKGADFTNNGTYTHNSGTVAITGNVTIAGTATTSFFNLRLTSGILTGHATNMNIEGTFTNNSTFAHNNGKVTFTAGNAQSIAGSTTPTTFYNLEINKTAGTTVTQTVTTVTVSNLLTMTEGIFDINTLTLNGAGGLTATGGDLQIGKTTTVVPELTGTYTLTGGTITLDGAGNQTLKTATSIPSAVGADVYYNLVFGISGAKTIAGLLTINGNATVSGSATIAATNSAFVQACAKTFTYGSTGNTTLAAGVNVTVGSYTHTGSGQLNNGSNSNFIVTGSAWNKSAGTFSTAGTGRAIFQGCAIAQTFTETAATTFIYVTINNASDITLNNNMTISGDLNFTAGNIVTGSNFVILNATTTTVTRTSGHVYGNLRKAIVAGVSSRTFEIGYGADYLPIDFTFGGATTAGNLTCSANNGDHPFVFSSTINSSKSVNRYWSVTNNSIATINYSAVFNFLAGDVDPGATTGNFDVQRYDGVAFWTATTVGTKNATNTQITGESVPASGTTRAYGIGENFGTLYTYNRLSNGTYNWSDLTTWIQERSNSITATNGSVNVVCPGSNCNFTTSLIAGDVLMFQATPGTVIGVISSITDDNNLVLTAVYGGATTTGSYGREKVPTSTDMVRIGNDNANAGATTITVDVNGSAVRIEFLATTIARNNILQHNSGVDLAIGSSIIINQPSSATNAHQWAINGGTATVQGNVQIGSGISTPNRVSRVDITTGTLTIVSNLVFFPSTTAANAVLTLNGGAGTATVNLAGVLNLDGATYYGTFTAGSNSIFNYNGTSAQTVNMGVNYANLYINNTNIASGATLAAAVTTTNVTQNLFVQSGTLKNGGFPIAGNGTKTFQVSNGAKFYMTGTSTFPTGFGTFTFGASSNTYYEQTTNPITITNVASPGYGNLFLHPAGTATQRFSNTTYYMQGNLTVGDATNTTTVNATGATATVNISGSVIISANATLNCSTNAMDLNVGGDWTNSGGTFTPGTRTIKFNGSGAQQINGTAASQTFYDINVDKPAGALTVGGSTIAITSNDITLAATNVGSFTAPASLSLNATASASDLILSGGTFIAGATINITGNWTRNSTLTAFTHNSGTVNFTGTAGQIINGTNLSETFNNIVLAKTAGQTLSTAGSIATITTNNYTQATGNFTAPATMNIGGNMLLTAGTYTAGANTNLSGNMTYNGGTLTPGANTFTFNGSASQSVSGSATYPDFNNITIDNSFPGSAVVLSKPVNVNGVFTLTDGHMITTSTNILTLGATATVTLNAPVTQDSSFVKGPVNITYATTSSLTKILPISKDNKYRRSELTIAHTATTSTQYTCEYFHLGARSLGWTKPAGVDSVSLMGYWDLNQGVGALVASASIKLYYFPENGVTDPANLCVLKGNPSVWTNIGGTGTAVGTGTITSTINFTTFSYFTFGNRTGGTNPLPIELLSFTAIKNVNKVDLNWTTATETNNDYFTVENSADGEKFEVIAHVDGAGNSVKAIKYSTVDLKPFNGISYYRLRQTDFDGKYTYSNIVSVDFASNETFFTIFPNPSVVGEAPQLRFTIDEVKGVLVVVNDINGKEVFSKVTIVEKGDDRVLAIDPTNTLPAGTYIISASSDNSIYRQKLIIK
ncbi:MAG: T9SS type A sorting domain-containing protein [Bacteroidetes bacterium]|nr:T9SS type A sorting domain-containing protein [Bacteroidota bacterium]